MGIRDRLRERWYHNSGDSDFMNKKGLIETNFLGIYIAIFGGVGYSVYTGQLHYTWLIIAGFLVRKLKEEVEKKDEDFILFSIGEVLGLYKPKHKIEGDDE